MKVAWATDVHLDFVDEADVLSFCDGIRGAGVEALLLGGDIATAGGLRTWLQFLADKLAQPIYFVLGNHDYYGSDIRSVRRQAEALQSDRLTWLPAAGVVELTPTVGLVGNGGWGDGRNGDFASSQVVLNDFFLIRDLREASGLSDPLAGLSHKGELAARLRRLGEEAAALLAAPLAKAASRYPAVLVLTHVPPFPEACWHNGEIAGADWLPFFSCRAIGDLLLSVAASNPEVEFRVYCGHTHGAGQARIAPNVLAYTGEAAYGRLAFRVIDLEEVRHGV